MTNQTVKLRSYCQINFNSTNGTECLLFKVLVIDRTTAYVVNTIWQDGFASRAEVVGVCCLTCNFFPVDCRRSSFRSNICVWACNKTRL